MKQNLVKFLPCALSAVALAAFWFVLRGELEVSRSTVESWAERDLAVRTQLATESIEGALSAGDFAKVREFALAHESDDLRLTVLSSPGGMVYDSETSAAGSRGERPEVREALEKGVGSIIRESATAKKKMIYCARKARNGFIVRLGLPYESVTRSLEMNRPSMILSGLIGACGILLVLLFTLRLAERNRQLARERDMQVRLVKELERVANFRRDFIANVSHEIKTPLTGILGATEMLTSDVAGDLSESEKAELFALLRRESLRLDALAKDILSLSKLEQSEGCERENFKACSVGDVIRSATDATRSLAEGAGMRLVVNVPENECVIDCDSRLIEQAVTNLIVNAVRHSHSPDVIVSLEAVGEKCVIEVTDHGIGIAEADCERIFERFYRVDKAHSRDGGGTGLGLAIVKHIAQLHGGDVMVKSEIGCGTIFKLTITNSKTERKLS